MTALEKLGPYADIEVNLSALLDKRDISIRELMTLRNGSLLTTTKPIGERLDLIVQDVHLGSAELLILSEKVAVRVTQIAEAPDRE